MKTLNEVCHDILDRWDGERILRSAMNYVNRESVRHGEFGTLEHRSAIMELYRAYERRTEN